MTETRKRVKVYVLNSERQWQDRGTGYVSTPYVKQLKGISLTVVSEIDGNQLLQVKIHPHVAYQKQQDTLIVWSENKDLDLALSFQEKPSCEEVWKIICQLQGKDSSVDVTQEIVEESEDDKFGFLSDSFPDIDLPFCELCSLKDISEVIASNMQIPVRREKLAAVIDNDGYIEKLLTLFRECEDLEYTEGLQYLHGIFNNIFLLNKSNLCEEMLQESNILDVIGCLEYDSNSSSPKRYRQTLKDLTNYKNVIPITNPELLNKIHHTYRIQFIQDIILPIPPITENNMFSAISNMLLVNKMDIVTWIQNDDAVLCQLFTLLNDKTTDKLKKRDLILFLRELFIFAQCLQSTERESFCKILTASGIFQTFETNFDNDDTRSRTALVDILNCFVEYSPSTVREYIIRKNGSDDLTFMNVLTSLVIHDKDVELGGASQIFCILKTLLDPENMLLSGNYCEKSEFLRFFYHKSANILFGPLLNCNINDPPPKTDYRTQQLLGLIVDFLSYCVENHTYHIQNFIIDNDLLKKALTLMKSEHMFVALGALKLLRKIVGQLDETYNNYVIKGNLVAPVVESLIKIKRNNILCSAILEMFHFINVEGSRRICMYVVDNFWHVLKELHYTKIFASLKMRSDSYREASKEKEKTSSETPQNTSSSRYRRDERDLEEEEEKWFDTDEVEESNSTRNERDDDGEEPLLEKKTSEESKDNKENTLQEKKNDKEPDRTSSSVKPHPITSGKLLCKRALVDYEGDSDDEDEDSPPIKRNKLS
ncbi:Serine/threonine-protein phosphatase 4 regulatory subunit 3 [Gryllus bimaculatus]|nr:Serine/threonine-protein phosphatase 4 regulatory subunit 3 [Gryllus bimaculatus]